MDDIIFFRCVILLYMIRKNFVRFSLFFVCYIIDNVILYCVSVYVISVCGVV